MRKQLKQTIYFLGISLAIINLSGCAQKQKKIMPTSYLTVQGDLNNVDPNAQSALIQAATSISQSLQQLNNMPLPHVSRPRVQKALIIPAKAQKMGLGQSMALNYNGPIQNIIHQMATAIGYKLNTIGQAPNIPINIVLENKSGTAASLLYQVQIQSSNQATVSVYPSTHLIELHFNNNKLPASNIPKPKAATPSKIDNGAPLSNNGIGLNRAAALQWTGPMTPPLKQIASASGYELIVHGTAPISPIIVSIDTQHSTLASILRNIQYQAGNKAEVSVNTLNKQIILSYTSQNL